MSAGPNPDGVVSPHRRHGADQRRAGGRPDHTGSDFRNSADGSSGGDGDSAAARHRFPAGLACGQSAPAADADGLRWPDAPVLSSGASASPSMSSQSCTSGSGSPKSRRPCSGEPSSTLPSGCLQASTTPALPQRTIPVEAAFQHTCDDPGTVRVVTGPRTAIRPRVGPDRSRGRRPLRRADIKGWLRSACVHRGIARIRSARILLNCP